MIAVWEDLFYWHKKLHIRQIYVKFDFICSGLSMILMNYDCNFIQIIVQLYHYFWNSIRITIVSFYVCKIVINTFFSYWKSSKKLMKKFNSRNFLFFRFYFKINTRVNTRNAQNSSKNSIQKISKFNWYFTVKKIQNSWKPSFQRIYVS